MKNRWLLDADPQPPTDDNEMCSVPPALKRNDSQSSSELEFIEDVLISDSESELSNSVILVE